MSMEFKEFKKDLIQARFLKKIDKFLEFTANNLKLFPFSNEDDKTEECDEILIGKWIDPPVTKDKIQKFRIELATELFPIMNALIRAAVEEYAKKVDSKKSIKSFLANNNIIINKYRMRYDKDLNHELDVLNINRFLRNHYLHYLPQEKSDWKTKKDHKSILKRRLWISSRGERIFFVENEEEVCQLLENEKKIFGSCHIKGYHYVEFLTWRIKNLIKEIDENR